MASVRRKSQKERVLLARQATMPAAPVHEGILQAARAPISCFSATPEVKADQGFFERVGSILDQYRNPDLLESTVSAPLLEEAPVQGKLMENVKLSKRELDNLYEEALYTIMHRSGETTEDYVNEDYELYGYLKRVFNLSQMDHEALMEKVKEAKPPVQVLKVTVVEAKGLMSKDPDGFSDPYCMLGIMPGSKDSPREAAEEKKERKFSLRRRSDKRTPSIKEVLPAKFIQATEVKPHTLDPQWKESFSLDIDDIQTDTLHLDIWDHDDDVSVVEACSKLNEVHSLKGMGSYFKQIVKSARTTNASGSAEEHVDDFLGCLDIPLNDLPSTGVDKWCKLEPRTSSSKVQGWCHLLLNLTSSQRDTLLSKKVSNVTVYEMLMEHFIAYQHNMQGGLSTWDGELSKCAKTVLHQHAVQTDIPPAQQAILHWQAYSKYHQANAISYTCLHNALQRVEQSFQDASVAHEQQQSLAESFNAFLEFCLGLLRKIRDVFPSTNPEATSRLEALLGCLSEFYGTQVFKKVCPFHNDLYLEINSVIKKGTQEWYEQMNSTFKAGGKSEEEKLQGLVKITNAVLSDLYKNRDHYNKMFASAVKVEYFSVTYRQLEKLISDEVSSSLEEPGGSSEGDVGALSQPSGEAMLQLYLNLRELHGLSDSLPARDGKPLALASFHGWFKVLMLRWLQLVHQKAKERISESVKADGLDFLNAQVKYSSSALSTTECLSHIRDLWKGLQWPPASATPILSKLMQNFCNCAHFYMELVKRKVEAGGYYRADGQFDVSNQLCVALNGMEYVRQFVCALPKELGLTDAEVAGAPAVGGGLPVGGAAGGGTTWAPLAQLHALDSAVQHEITAVIAIFAEKMSPDIRKYIQHISLSPDSIQSDEAVSPLMKYLDNNLAMLNRTLLKENFNWMLQALWKVILGIIVDVVAADQPHTTEFYSRFDYTLQVLVAFFHAEGQGLPMTVVYNEEYKTLRDDFITNKMPTQDLIEQYFLEKLSQQKPTEPSKYGSLNAICYYNSAEQKVVVEIMSATNLIPLDSNGLSDPFVIVELGPQHYFPHLRSFKTQVKPKTLQPVFNEQFTFPTAVEPCRRKAACLSLAVMDYDWLSRDELEGEVILPLAELQGVPVEAAGAAGATGAAGAAGAAPTESLSQTQGSQPVLTLHLGHPKASRILKILEARVADKEAQEFVKKRRDIEETSQALE